jgi:signal peptidase I
VTTDDLDAAEPAVERRRRQRPLWQEFLVIVVVATGLAIIVKTLLLQAFYIPSESMEPGLVRNDRILVQKVSYELGGSPERGDVVVFKDPGDWLPAEEAAGPTGSLPQLMERIGLYPSGGHLVKRVIGVAGDVIKCCDKKGRISVNGQPLNEDSYVKEKGIDCNGPMIGDCSSDSWTAGPVPKGHIFVMGDNRGHSADSTVHMCTARSTDCVPGDEYVPVDLVVGKVFVLLWPSDHFRWIHRPSTFADVPNAS